MFFHDKKEDKRRATSIIVLVTLVFAIGLLFFFVDTNSEDVEREIVKEQLQKENKKDDLENTELEETLSIPEDWQTYRSSEFQFKMRYPATWHVSTTSRLVETGDTTGTSSEDSSRSFVPAITFIPGDTFLNSRQEEPYTQRVQKTHVSVYPRGVPTESVEGQRVEASLLVPSVERVIEQYNYILADGSPWASSLKFKNTPPSWNGNGFVFAGLFIEDYETICIKEGKEVSSDQCDVSNDNEIIREGSVDNNVRDIEKKMISTFSFTE